MGKSQLAEKKPLVKENTRLKRIVVNLELELILKHAKPEHIRSDNGQEFIAESLPDWPRKVGITSLQIYPGSSWENGYNERFNGTLRREVLNAEWFTSLHQAQTVINTWG